MSKSIISVKNLGKKYSIGEKQNFYTLRDTVAGLFSDKKKKQDDFWALKDVNFDIKQGESVGIIGRNGAGKSTLLKILSQITPPTTGKITMRGRVASLLEVGTGFHQELTGRENIFLNGAILGMSREEVRKKFDEIVAFSEVEKFIDMPVKHYSSGMYMRLAFAVAAHLESEILIVDEVLAVGDAQFQKKCLGKMDDVAKKEGRTVLFVSHNMVAVRNLCRSALMLDKGRIVKSGTVDSVLKVYSSFLLDSGMSFGSIATRKGNGKLKISKIELYSEEKQVKSLTLGVDAKIKIHLEPFDRLNNDVDISIGFDNFYGERVLFCSTRITGKRLSVMNANYIELLIPRFPLVEGVYRLSFFVSSREVVYDWVVDAVAVNVINAPFYEGGDLVEGQSSLIVDHSFNVINS